MGKISATTHTFCREVVSGKGGTCLYRSFLSVIKPLLKEIFGDIPFTSDLMKALNEDLRIRVAHYILSHPEMHDMILIGNTGYKTVEEYCSAIVQGELWGGDLELAALSGLHNILVCVIYPTNIFGDRLMPSYYVEDNPLAKKCVYIFHNGTNHFDPLHMMNKKNPNKKETIFDPNDQPVNNLLEKFINEELKRKVTVVLGIKIGARANEVSNPGDGSNEVEMTSNLFLPNITMKRRVSELDDIVKPPNDNKNLPISISNKYYLSSKRIKVAEDSTDQMSTFYENNSESMTTEELVQANNVLDGFDPNMNQQEIVDRTAALNDEPHEEKVEVGKEPINKLDDGIQDNDKFKYNSEPSKAKPSS